MNKLQKTGNGQIDDCDINLTFYITFSNFVLKKNINQWTNYLVKISLPYS